jgi:hypothetical protein
LEDLTYYKDALTKFQIFRNLSRQLKSCLESEIIEFNEILKRFLLATKEFLAIDMNKLKFYGNFIAPKFKKIR